jgi:membrane protein required for colicin V production
MNSLDIMALAIIGVTLIQAFTKGLVAELAELAFAIAGLLFALLFFENIEMLLLKIGVGNPMAAMLGFILIFLVFIVLGAFGSSKIKKELVKNGLTWRDRFWGIPLGLTRGFVINFVLFLALQVFPVNPYLIKTSLTAPFFLSGSRIIKSVAPEGFRLLIPDGNGMEKGSPYRIKPVPSGKDRDDIGAPDENTIEKI